MCESVRVNKILDVRVSDSVVCEGVCKSESKNALDCERRSKLPAKNLSWIKKKFLMLQKYGK